MALTGRRRAEVIALSWGDITLTDDGGMLVNYRVKGGRFERREVKAPEVRETLLAYLRAAGRFDTIKPGDPLWTRHDRGC